MGANHHKNKILPSRQEQIETEIDLASNETEVEERLHPSSSSDDQNSKKLTYVYFYIFNTTADDVSEEQIDKQVRVLNKSFGGRTNNYYTACDGGEKERSLETRFNFHRKGTRFFKDKYRFVSALDEGFLKTTRGEIFETVEQVFDVDYIANNNITALSNTEIIRDVLLPYDKYAVFQLLLGKVYGHEDCEVLSVFVLPNTIMERVLGIGSYPWDCAVPDSANLFSDNILLNRVALPDASAQAEGTRVAQSPFEQGIVFVREVGHWLGLFDTFYGGYGFTGCFGGAGDQIADTPAMSTPTRGCPVGKDTCPEQPGVDPIANFMDFSDDCCASSFTDDQARRMWYSWKAFRKVRQEH